jgi:hypothetical protein
MLYFLSLSLCIYGESLTTYCSWHLNFMPTEYSLMLFVLFKQVVRVSFFSGSR